MKPKYDNVDKYIAMQAAELRPMLEQIRRIIKSAIPQAEEVISYHIPSYKYHGMLVGFGTHKNGCSFYAMDAKILNSFSEDLKNYTYAVSTIHFDSDKKLPVALINKIIGHRIIENENRAKKKGRAKNILNKKQILK